MKLVIGVTRKCHLNCDHCLRGCSQNMDIKKEYIDELFNQLNKVDIGCLDLTLTGGEPSLNIPMINYIIEKLENSNITLSMFYIATNGINNNNIDFIIPCIKLYNLADVQICKVDEFAKTLKDNISECQLQYI